MACRKHVNPRDTCLICMKELVLDASSIVRAMHDRLEVLEDKFPFIREEMIKIEREIPLIRSN